jgi:hypothetical protein
VLTDRSARWKRLLYFSTALAAYAITVAGEDEWKAFTSKPRGAREVPPGKRLPTAEEFFGPRPLSLEEAIDKLGDYIKCAPRP